MSDPLRPPADAGGPGLAAQLEGLESQVAALSKALQGFEARLSALESPDQRPAAAGPSSATATSPAVTSPPRQGGAAALSAAALAPMAGRTVLTLAGAFVLRWLTDSGTLPPGPGVGLGFAYALGLAWLVDREGAAGRGASATFHGVAAALIGFPLVVEATVRFQILPAWAGATLLTLLASLTLAAAARRGLRGLGWAVVTAALAACIGLMVGDGPIVPPVMALLALGLVTAWLGYVADWYGPRWPAALVLDLGVVLLALRAAAGGAEGSGAALLVVALLLASTLASVAARTLVMGRSVVPFEIAQIGGALAAGIGSAAFLSARTGQGLAAFGAAGLVLGLACYAVAFAWLARRLAQRDNFRFYGGVGMLLLLAGSALALPLQLAAAGWAVLGLLAAALARRQASRTLAVQAVLYAFTAAAGGGLLTIGARALLGSAALPWPEVPPSALLAGPCAVLAAWFLAGSPPRDGWPERVPQAALLALAVLATAGLAAHGLAGRLGPPGPEADLGAIATGRTALLALASAAAARLGARPAWRELGWLAWPLLGLGGLKLLVDDLPRGRPATLVLSFACYGAALILVPRLRTVRQAAADHSSRVG